MHGLEITILLVNLVIFGGMFLVWLAEYILQGMGLYKLAQAQGLDSPWMAFVPWLRTYLHGRLAGTISFGKKEMKNPGLWMVILPIVFGGIIGVTYLAMIMIIFVGAIGTIGTMGVSDGSAYASGVFTMIIFFVIFGILMIVAIAYTAFMCTLRGMVNYQIYKSFNPESKAVLHTLLSLFVPMYQAIYFFLLRKRVHVAPRPQPPYCMQQPPHQEAELLYEVHDGEMKSE